MAPARPRARWLIATALAVAVASALTSVLAVRDPQNPWNLGGIGLLATVLCGLAGLTGVRTAATWGVLLLALEYALSLLTHGGRFDVTAPLFGLGLLVLAELCHTAADWSHINAIVVRAEVRRWLVLCSAALGGASCSLVLVVAALSLPQLGTIMVVAGCLGVVALTALVRRMALTWREQSTGVQS